jgi:hypothetical protein
VLVAALFRTRKQRYALGVHRFLAVIGLTTIGITFAATGADAQVRREVSEARTRALSGEFDRALSAFEGALERSDLGRDDLIAIYEARVFIHFARSESAEMRAELARIAALDPQHAFDTDYFPAGVTDVFREVVGGRAGALSLAAEAVVLASGEFEVRAEVQNDPGDLTQSVRVHGRGVDDDAWSSGEDTLRVSPDGAPRGEYYAEAVGPGGAVLASRGSEGAPLSVDLLAVSASGEDDGGGVPLWVWIAGGAGLVAIAVVVIVLVATSGGGTSDDTQPTAPMVSFSM